MRILIAAAVALILLLLTSCGNTVQGDTSDGSDSSAANQESDYEIEYKDGGVKIVGYNGEGGDVTIPEQIGGMPVAEIGARAFEGCTSLTGVSIHGGIGIIGDDAFADCTSLSSVTIEDGVREIDEYAFSNCTALTRIDIPDSVTAIGRFAFSGCIDLTVAYHGRIYFDEKIFEVYTYE